MSVLTPFLCRTCISQTVASRLCLSSSSEITEGFGAGTIEADLAFSILFFFVEDKVKRLKGAGYRDAKGTDKTDMLALFVREEGRKVLKGCEEDAVVAEALGDVYPETEEQRREAFEFVFRELGLGGTRMQVDMGIEMDAESWSGIEREISNLRLNDDLYSEP
jgi:hypothetical protein